MLTSAVDADGLTLVARRAREAGAHWIYFHPMCIRWDLGMPTQASQEGVIKALEMWNAGGLNNFKVFVFRDRYKQDSIEFNHYHAAHFLLVVGADGKNYLGAEVKYL